jgi:hypothetical protein
MIFHRLAVIKPCGTLVENKTMPREGSLPAVLLQQSFNFFLFKVLFDCFINNPSKEKNIKAEIKQCNLSLNILI